MTIRLVAIDDHPMVRADMCSELEHSGADLVIVDEAADVEGAIAVCHELKPNVALLDMHLPGGRGGGGAGMSVRCQNVEGLYFLALSVSDSPKGIVQVIRSDTCSYVTKSISTPKLVGAIQRVVSGNVASSPRPTNFIFDASGTGQVAVGDNEFDPLPTREQEVMRLIARGYTYREVGSELFISVKIVEAHASTVLRKLQLSNRNKLTHWAMQRHIM